MVEIKVPDFGEGLTEGILIEWFKKEGDKVEKGGKLCAVETAKANTEIISSCDGVVDKIYKKVKDVLETDQILCTIKEKTDSSNKDSEQGSVFSSSDTGNKVDFEDIMNQLD